MLPSKSRALLLGALTTAGVLLGSVVVAQQSPPAAANPQPVPPAAVRAVASPLVQGVVVDQQARPVDGVKVQAISAEGDVAGSALTYASDRENGPQHGYFFVEVPRGSYQVTLSKAGYRTVTYDAGQITKRVKRISLGEIEIERLPAPTTTGATLGRAKVTTKDRGSVTVTVASGATSRPTGDVEIREGRAVVGSGNLVARDKGKVTVTLGRLAKGDHVLKAYFLGTDDLKASSSKGLTLHVVAKRR